MISSISHDLRTHVDHYSRTRLKSLLDGAMKRPEQLRTILADCHAQHQTGHTAHRRYAKSNRGRTTTILLFPFQSMYVTISWIGQGMLNFSHPGRAYSSTFTSWMNATRERIWSSIRNGCPRFSTILSRTVFAFTFTGGVITVRAEIAEHTVTVEISDTGKGFSKVDLEHMFDRFYQGDTSRSEIGHSGLGLYTAKTLVEKRRGTITAGNNPDGGAYVRFTIREHDISKDKM